MPILACAHVSSNSFPSTLPSGSPGYWLNPEWQWLLWKPLLLLLTEVVFIFSFASVLSHLNNATAKILLQISSFQTGCTAMGNSIAVTENLDAVPKRPFNKYEFKKKGGRWLTSVKKAQQSFENHQK